MRAAFRADASATIGGGHVMRCLTLARALQQQGTEVVFMSSRGTAEAAPALARSDFPILLVAEEEAAAATLEAYWSTTCDVVIIDSYGLDAKNEAQFRRVADRIIVIDDLANRQHDCDLLLDQTYGRSAEAYSNLVPARSRVLTGTHYALLRPEFAIARSAALARRALCTDVGRILISMGLTDVAGITGQVVAAVLEVNTGALIDVVLGSDTQSLASIQAAEQKHPELKLHVDTTAVCQLMVDADLAIGAGGSTMWERCCLGLPTIALIIADNQRFAASQLSDIGCCIALDAVDHTPTNLAVTIRDLVLNNERRDEMSHCARAVCDGLGTTRFLDEMRLL